MVIKEGIGDYCPAENEVIIMTEYITLTELRIMVNGSRFKPITPCKTYKRVGFFKRLLSLFLFLEVQ